MGVAKDGPLSGSVASVLADAAQWQLGRYCGRAAAEGSPELGDGNIDADPCRRGPQEKCLRLVSLASACWFDEKRDKPHYLQKTTPEEFWAAGGRGGDAPWLTSN